MQSILAAGTPAILATTAALVAVLVGAVLLIVGLIHVTDSTRSAHLMYAGVALTLAGIAGFAYIQASATKSERSPRQEPRSAPSPVPDPSGWRGPYGNDRLWPSDSPPAGARS